MSRKLTKQDLKGPDEFITTTQGVVDFIQENPRRVALGLAACVLLLGASLGVRAYRDANAERLDAVLGDATTRLAKGELEEAADAFRRVAEEYPGTAQASVALAQAGSAWAELERTDQARSAFEELLQSASEPRLRQIALYNLGILDRDGGDRDRAAERLEEAARLDGPLKAPAWAAGALLANKGPAELPEGLTDQARAFFAARKEG